MVQNLVVNLRLIWGTFLCGDSGSIRFWMDGVLVVRDMPIMLNGACFNEIIFNELPATRSDVFKVVLFELLDFWVIHKEIKNYFEFFKHGF